MWYPPLLRAARNAIFRGRVTRSPAPTNQFLENEKLEKVENNKIKKKKYHTQLATTTSPSTTEVLFFGQNMHVCVNRGSNRLPQAYRTFHHIAQPLVTL